LPYEIVISYTSKESRYPASFTPHLPQKRTRLSNGSVS
jgi:hypothetical protein